MATQLGIAFSLQLKLCVHQGTGDGLRVFFRLSQRAAIAIRNLGRVPPQVVFWTAIRRRIGAGSGGYSNIEQDDEHLERITQRKQQK